MNSREILHLGKFYWPEFGGMETALRDLAESGLRLGCRVRCVVSQPSLRDPETRELIRGVEVIRLRSRLRIFSAPHSPGFLREPISAGTVLHLHLPHPSAEIQALRSLRHDPCLRSARLIPYLHALPVRHPRLGAWWFSKFTSRVLDAAEAILISNESMIHAFPELGRWREKLRVVPFAAPPLRESELGPLLDKRDSSPVVLTVGRLVRYKGYDRLVRAWAKMREQQPELRNRQLRMIGSGPELERIRRLVAELGLDDSVFLLGRVSDEEKLFWLREAALFVAPSIDVSETFGIAILEAMAHALPVIATDLPTGVRELACGGGCGALADPGSVDSLAQALIRMLSDPGMRGSAALANLRLAAARHHPELSFNAYRSVIEERIG